MKIELKSIEYNERLSQETSYFSANIYIDGKHVGTAENRGNGGATLIRPNSLEKMLDEYGATLPPKVVPMGNDSFTIKQDGETLVGDLLTDWLVAQDLRKAMRNALLFTKKESPGLFSIKMNLSQIMTDASQREEFGKKFRTTKPEIDEILNFLPFDEALAIYKTMGV